MPPTDLFLRPLVLSGPSGTGKSTLLKKLLQEFPDKFGFSVSHTTRSPRAGETNGVAYHFTDRNTFKDLIDRGAFIEHAEYSTNLYGTTTAAVDDVTKSGRRCILDIDSQGVKSLKRTSLNPFYLFIAPPTIIALRERLQGRGTESDDAVESRLQAAITEIEYARQPGIYEAVVVNDDLNRAYDIFKRIALGERTDGDDMPSRES